MKTKVATGLPVRKAGRPNIEPRRHDMETEPSARKTGLAPLVCEDPRLLILGSLPGDRSLELQQYYGHPQNRFWKVIAAVHALPCPADYAARKEMLATCRIGLWDVYHAASRPGSMDADIRKGEFNDIAGLLLRFPGIDTIALNGSAAAAGFDKYLRMTGAVISPAEPVTRQAEAVTRQAEAVTCTAKQDTRQTEAITAYEVDGIRAACAEIAGRRLHILHLPSTSPANARWTPDKLISVWKYIRG